MAQTVAGQQAGLLPAGAAAALWESVFCPANGGFCALAGSIPDYGEVYKQVTGFDPTMEFSSTTGRFVVDYFINDDSMMYRFQKDLKVVVLTLLLIPLYSLTYL